jgi:hypothetical protein
MKIREYSVNYCLCGLPDEVVAAGEFLEARGYRFLIDFGWQNAIDKAAEVLCDEIDLGTVWVWQTTIWTN